MKLAQFRPKHVDDRIRLGIIVDNKIVDVAAATSALGGTEGALAQSADLATLLGDPEVRRVVVDIAERVIGRSSQVAQSGAPLWYALDDVAFEPPVTNPGKILCMGRNFRGHFAELTRWLNQEVKPPPFPRIFTKVRTSLLGHGGAIVRPPDVADLDYELELAIVIGRRCRGVKRADADAYIGGYTLLLDISAREFQKKEHEAGAVFLGAKNYDTFCPLGAHITTADEVGDASAIDMRLFVNGERRQASNTRDMIFSFGEALEYWSAIMTFEPGDILTSGSPAGVAFADDQPRYLQPGDRIDAEIDRVGHLSVHVVDEPASG